jgi:hypothetical protein
MKVIIRKAGVQEVSVKKGFYSELWLVEIVAVFRLAI